MRVFFILTIISLSSPLITGDKKFDEFLREALEMFRSQMKNGIPDLGIPILDPLDAPNISLKVNEGILHADFNVSEIVVRNLSNFDIKSVHLDVDKMNLSMQLKFPLLNFHGIYDCDGNITFIFVDPIHGRGNVTFNITDFQFGLSTTIARIGDHIQLTSLNLSLEIDAVKVDIDNIFGSKEIAKIVNGILSTFGKSLFDLERKTITNKLENMLLDLANDILRNISVNSLVPVSYEPDNTLERSNSYERHNNGQEHYRPILLKIDDSRYTDAQETLEEKNYVEPNKWNSLGDLPSSEEEQEKTNTNGYL